MLLDETVTPSRTFQRLITRRDVTLQCTNLMVIFIDYLDHKSGRRCHDKKLDIRKFVYSKRVVH